MATFNLNITGGSQPYTISVKAEGDNTERFMSYSGGVVTFQYNSSVLNYTITVSKSGCTTASQSFTLNCGSPVPIPVPIPTCNIVTNVSISGNSNPNTNTSTQYTLLYTGSNISSINWSVSGGANIISQSGNTANISFPSSGGYTISVSYVSCGNTYTVTKSITTVTCTPISNLDIFGSTSIQENTEGTFVATYTGSSSNISSYQWSVTGSGNYITFGANSEVCSIHFGTNSGTVTVSIISCGQTFTASKNVTVTPTPVPTPIPVAPTPVPQPIPIPVPVEVPTPIPIPVPVDIPTPQPVPVPIPVVDCSCVYNFVNVQSVPTDTPSTYNSGNDTYSVTQTINTAIFASGTSCDPTLTNSLVSKRIRFINPVTNDVYYDAVHSVGDNSFTVNYPGSFYRVEDLTINVECTYTVNRTNGCTGTYTVAGTYNQNVYDWGETVNAVATGTQPNCATSTTGKIVFTNITKGVKWKACNASSFICTNDCSSPDGTITSNTFTFDSGYINGFGNQYFTIRIWEDNNVSCSNYTDYTVLFTESLC